MEELQNLISEYMRLFKYEDVHRKYYLTSLLIEGFRETANQLAKERKLYFKEIMEEISANKIE